MPKPSLDGSQPDFRNKNSEDDTRRLSRDLNNLQQEIRVDFEHRISGLTNLMNKFRTLMAHDIRTLTAANDSAQTTDNIPVLTNKIDDAALAGSQVISESDRIPATNEYPVTPSSASDQPVMKSQFQVQETARFEAGLYQLNCQLYRFRLELDQELEYRDEPLHEHFNDQSELASVLQLITQKKQQEKNAGY